MSEKFINSNILGYLDKNPNCSVSDVTSALSNISEDIYHLGQKTNSIFDLEEDTELSYDDFLKLMSDAAQMDVSNLNKDEMQLLFNLLNTDDGDNVLTYDELQVIARNGEITDMSLWSAVTAISDEKVNKASKSSSETEDTDTSNDTASTSGTSGNTTSTFTPKKTEDGKYDFSDAATAQWYIDVEKNDGESTPKEVADRLLKDEVISQEEYNKLKAAYDEYTDAQLEKIEARMTQKEISFEEAVEQLGFIAKSDFDKKFPLSESDAAQYANKLYDAMRGAGTDEKAVKDILENKNISDDDFVLIMEKYLGYSVDENGNVSCTNGKGSLIQHIESDFSWASTDLTEEEAMNLVGERLLNAANNGNEKAINIICLELMNATSGMTGTAEDFVNYIFENASPEMLAKIDKMYPQVNDGKTLTEDIKGDFSWASGIFTSAHSQNWYLDKINKAINSLS